jgi:GMP synthase-like glutamine amidotransferase
MRAHVLQHVAFEGPASIGQWLMSNGFDITFTRFYETGSILPQVDEVDIVVVMGGPMSVNDEALYPWLISEKRFVREVIDAEKPVLGICLGAQLIANAMGQRVYPNAEREIGWFPIQAVANEEPGVFVFPSETEVFHWHGETFNIPHGSFLLASSQGCLNQAFQFKSHVIGLQFHLETTPDSAREIAAHCRSELIPSRYVQDESEILAVSAERYQRINALMGDVLSHLVRGATPFQ